jgi:carbamoyl-phosphate synthase large subunit
MGPATLIVTGANGDIGEAIGRILRAAFANVVLIGVDVEGAGAWPGRRTFDDMRAVPRATDKRYFDTMVSLNGAFSPAWIIPTSEAELDVISRSPEALSGLPLLMNGHDVIQWFLDKESTAAWLSEIGVPVPRTTPVGDATERDLPLIVKPRRGRGGRGVELVETELRLRAAKEAQPDAIAQEFVGTPDQEFTCALLKCADVVRSITMRRKLSGGMTSWIRVEEHPAITAVLEQIAERLPDSSAVNVQLRLHNDSAYVFEINPRLSGTVMMRHSVGFSDLIWWLGSYEGLEPPDFVSPLGTEVFRVSSEVVVAAQ